MVIVHTIHYICTLYTSYYSVVLHKVEEIPYRYKHVQTGLYLQGRMENKATSVCSHTLSCAGLSGPRVGGGHHQLVCSPAGHRVGDMNGWD